MGIVHVRKHDRYQLEIKTDTARKGGSIDSQLDIWLFLPSALGISATEYSPEQFYSDLRTYTRLKTPRYTLEQLLENEDSPLLKIEKMLSRSMSDSRQKRLRQETRFLCIILRKFSETQTVVAQDTLPVIIRWRKVVNDLLSEENASNIHVKTRTCLQIVDELISNSWERLLIVALEESAMEAQQFIQDALDSEHQYRVQHNYFLYSEDKQDQYLFHFGNLVKYVSSVLYLDTRGDRFLDWLRHLAFGTAAGLAMVWALFVQIYALIEYGVNLSEGMSLRLIATFVGIGVFSYILKDRIKATSGSWLTRQMRKRLPDRSQHFFLEDETKSIAQISEKQEFVKVKELPEDIRSVYRNFQEWNPYFLFDSDVLHYQKNTVVHTNRARKQFDRFRGVVNIHRFHVWNWIKTLAPPKKQISVLTESGKVQRCKAPRVYTVNLLTKTTQAGKKTYQLYRILMNNRGLVSINPVSLNDVLDDEMHPIKN